ncbi:MAG TPA: hypothetical protein VN628_17995 [Vicinamibacterales bacterium]|nr:hypothetical protein [Vicinamibacterales bacterium]
MFVETSPSADDRHAAFTGFHVRPKLRLAQWQRVPFHVSLSAEYAFVKQPGDTDFRQALAITPILERHVRGMEVSFNPAIEIGLRGPEAGEAPIFEPSAKVAEQRHLIFPALDLRTAGGWDLNIGVGRGLTGGSEHWGVKWIVGLRLPR